MMLLVHDPATSESSGDSLGSIAKPQISSTYEKDDHCGWSWANPLEITMLFKDST